jgi:hypothetical protein
MNADDVRNLMTYLVSRVDIDAAARVVSFAEPSERDMLDAGIHPDAVRQVLSAAWWPEMISDVVETPEFCDPGDDAGQVLAYARDVVEEYVRKRFRL